MDILGFHIDGVVHLGDVIISIMTGLLGWGLRKSYMGLIRFMESISDTTSAVDLHAQVLDAHTEALRARGYDPQVPHTHLWDRRRELRRRLDH